MLGPACPPPSPSQRSGPEYDDEFVISSSTRKSLQEVLNGFCSGGQESEEVKKEECTRNVHIKF